MCRKGLSKVNVIQDSQDISYGNSKLEALQSSQNELSDKSDDDILYIKKTEPVNQISAGNDKWTTELTVNSTNLKFRLDTGAKCNIITKSDYDKLNNVSLEKSNKTLKSYSNHKIGPLGSVKLSVKHKDMNIAVNFEIVDLIQENILSGDTAVQLNLLKRVDLIHSDTGHELTRDFPELIQTTGTLPGKYTIKIEESAQCVIHPPKKLPAAIKPKAIAQLQLKNGGIRLYHTSSGAAEWVSSLVVSCRKTQSESVLI